MGKKSNYWYLGFSFYEDGLKTFRTSLVHICNDTLLMNSPLITTKTTDVNHFYMSNEMICNKTHRTYEIKHQIDSLIISNAHIILLIFDVV